jgi:serine protease Do
MSRKFAFCLILMWIAGFAFGQTAALRNYVGMISQGFHPDIVSFLEKLKSELDKRGYNTAARNLENIMKGDSGTGFVYVGSDKKNYILTNYHVISQAHTLSITFETLDGEKTKFSDLQIVAADEDMDIALLAFAGGQNPFKEGLSLLSRPVEEGEDVYSAGFPGTIGAMIWQLGRGIISNASVRLPPEDENDKAIGPYIQHTAQVDPGNSGGPLLVQARGVPTGYAVAGINTLSLRSRQAANYSIPVTRVRSFLDASLKPPAADQGPILEERVNAFIKGLNAAPKAVYPHIAQFLSNTCTGENAEYAIYELLEKAPRTVRDDVVDRDIISFMTYSVAWTIENSLRSKAGSISVKLDSINPGENGLYNVILNVNGGNVDSVWINEYGIWRIRKFGTSASGDKTRIEKKEKERKEAKRLRDDPFIMLSAGLATPFNLAAFGLDLTLKFGKYFGLGVRGYFGGEDFTQMETGTGLYIPITIGGSAALTPFVGLGVGAMYITNPDYIPNSWYNSDGIDEKITAMGVSIRGGLCFTMSAVPGLFLQGTYQRNLYTSLGDKDKSFYPDLIYIGIGYAW